MYHLVPSLVREMGDAYPELVRAQPLITETLKLEETKFKRTLDNGLKLLGESSASMKKGAVFPGDVAFKLYDTYGFPLDLTEDALKPRGITVDTAAFDAAMKKQKEAARGRLERLGRSGDRGALVRDQGQDRRHRIPRLRHGDGGRHRHARSSRAARKSRS